MQPEAPDNWQIFDSLEEVIELVKTLPKPVKIPITQIDE